MRIYMVENYQEMSRKAANIISAQIILKPDCTLGLATGATPEGIYGQLVEWFTKGDLDFSQVKSVNLDEYKDLAPEDKQSYHYYMYKHLFGKVNINPQNTFLPNGMAKDEAEECRRYDRVVETLGKVDLQLLGLGENGHIGFNEPGESFAKGTHCVCLSAHTRMVNSRFFDSSSSIPQKAYSVGIRTIMQAEKILLVVSGAKKAEALYQTIFGSITPAVPASILQLHPEVTIVADKEALIKIDRTAHCADIIDFCERRCES